VKPRRSNSKPQVVVSEVADLPPVPLYVISKDRQRIDTSGSRWSLRMSVDGGDLMTIDWARLCNPVEGVSLAERAVQLTRLALADRLTRKKAKTIVNDFYSVVRFATWYAKNEVSAGQAFQWSGLNESTLRAFLAHSLGTSERGNDLARLRVLYEWGVARQYVDFDPSMLRILKTIRAPGNLKGHNVRSRHPDKGPLSQSEREAVLQAIADQRGAREDRAVVMVHLELGINPSQAVRLKNHHLKRFELPREVGVLKAYQLLVPRTKKRTAHTEVKARPISMELGLLLESLQSGAADAPLLGWLDQDRGVGAIGHAMDCFVRSARIRSKRTGTFLHLRPRRLRYSLATEAAELGASDHHIAEILDHTDTQHVAVYRKTASTIADRMEQALDPSLAPIAKRFRGVIVEAEGEVPFPGVAPSVIPGVAPHLPAFPLDIGGIGFCGRDVVHHGLCELFPPLSCYLCPKFAAFRDGPHRRVLGAIERAATVMRTDADLRIAEELDQVEMAIRQLLKQLRHESDGAVDESNSEAQ
jgi:integrase